MAGTRDWEQVDNYLILFEKDMDPDEIQNLGGPFEKMYGLQNKIFKADALLGLGRLEEAVEVYSSIPEDLDGLKQHEVRGEYIGDPFRVVKSELKKRKGEELRELFQTRFAGCDFEKL